MMIGDSVYGHSLGAFTEIRELLDKKDVQLVYLNADEGKTMGYCGSSAVWVQCASSLFASDAWDVLVYNWALHDKSDHYAHFTIEEYETHLRKISTDFKAGLKPEARIIFPTTHPLPDKKVNAGVQEMNQVVAEVAAEFDPPIEVYDMYTKVAEYCQERKESKNFPDEGLCPSMLLWNETKRNVHMTKEGKKLFADWLVNEAILPALD
jgi:hypothetical protein